MINVIQDSLSSQYRASLSTIEASVDQCPDRLLEAPIGKLAFCQVAFHTLFFTDYYLGSDEESLREQGFHREHADDFRDYEELQPRVQRLFYGRDFISAYVRHNQDKAKAAISAETEQSLAAPCGFPPKTFSRLELYFYNLRHIQHHAAQLSLRLLIDTGEGVRWYGSA